MDQRRFISFMLLALGVFLLAGQLFPPPKPAEKQPGAAAPAKDAKDNAQPKGAVGEAKKSGQPEAAKQPLPPARPGNLPAVVASSLPAQYVAIGSVDPDSGYRMLVTLSNSGAAVVRAEMSSPRYRDQEDWNGYLGDLELKDVPGGAQVQVVGAGTPAANSKIKAGDVIVGVGHPQTALINSAAELATALVVTKPGQEFTLQVRRGDNGPQPITVRLMRRPFAVVRPEIENYRMREVQPPKDFVDRPSFLLRLSELNGKPLSENDAKRLAAVLETGNWELTAHDEKSAVFRRKLPELKLEILKRYTLAAVPADQIGEPDYPAYHLQLDVELHSTGTDPQQIAYCLDGATGMSLEGWWYARKIGRHWGGGSLRDVVVRFDGSSVNEIENSQIAKGKAEPMEGAALEYAGVDSQYFSAILIPQLSAVNDSWFVTTEAVIVGTAPDVKTALYANPTCRLTRKTIELPAGKSRGDSYQVFLGPKRPELLSKYYPKSAKSPSGAKSWPGDDPKAWAGDPNYSLKDLIYYGWFGSVARIMLAILHFFYGVVRNYGIAIILLTVLVRGLMFPISYKQTQNMARMQALKPEMDRINEKYKTDLQKKSQATQELYRKHSINPLGGCLPLFLQMPVFIGLYRALMVDVELRQSPLFWSGIRWCSNLAAPDMFLNWSSFMPPFITQGLLGPYLNIFPIVTVSVMLVTQKMSMPPPSNDQAAMQQKMMKYMMIFFAVMFYKVAAGLCLYLIVSSLWGIAERKLLPKTQPAGATALGDSTTGLGTGGKRPRGDGSNGNGGPKKPRKAKRKK